MTGWPWPLDGVQRWFESLWSWINNAVSNAASWVVENLWRPFERFIAPIWSGFKALAWEGYQVVRKLTENIPWPWQLVFEVLLYPAAFIYATFKPAFSWLYDKLSAFVQPVVQQIVGFGDWAWKGLQSFVKDPVGTLKAGWDWVTSEVNRLLGGALNTISSSFSWLRDRLTEWFRPAYDAIVGFGDWAWKGLQSFVRDPVGTLRAGWDWVVGKVGAMFDGAVSTLRSHIDNAFASFAGIIGESLKAFWNWLVGSLGSIFSSAGAWINENIVKPVWSGLNWLWKWVSEGAKGLFNSFTGSLGGVVERLKKGDATAVWDVTISYLLTGLAIMGIMSVVGMKIAGTGIEVGEIGSFLKDLLNPSIITSSILGTMLAVGVTTPLRQYYNSLLRTNLPSAGDLRTYYLRKYIDIGVVREVLAKQGLPDSFIDAEIKSWRVIPGISDLITFVVREVITPEDFYMWADMQGLDKYWAEKYWEAHWVLPSFGNLREAFWRGIITEEEFRKFIVWHDYKPEPRPGISKSDQDIIAELSYELPGRIDARWMFEQGAIDFEQLKKLYAMSGLHPDWIGPTVEATARAVMRSEIESLVREAMYDYRDGWLTREEFIELMQTLDLAPKLQEYWLARADMLAERQIREEEYEILLNSFRLGIIDEKTFREELKGLGMRDDRIERVIQLEVMRKLGKRGAS